MPATGLRFLALNLGHFYTHMFLLLHPTVVLAMQRSFGGDYGELLLPSTAAFVAFGAGTLPAGWLGDRVSREVLIAVMFFGLAAGAAVTAAAPDPLTLALGLGLIGLAAAIYHPVGIALVVEGREKVGRALGVNGVFGNLGVAAAPLVAGGLASLYDWRAAFALPAAAAALTGAAYVGLLVRQGRRGQAPRRPAPTPPAEPLTGPALARLFAILAVAAFCGGLIFHSTTIVLPKLFEARLGGGADLLGIGIRASIVLTVAAFTQILVGTLIDRQPIRPVFVLITILQVPLLLAAGVLEGVGLLLLSLVLMAAVFGEIPIHDTLVARHVGSAWRSRLYALKYVLSLGVSALAVPLVSGLHAYGGGFQALFVVLAGMAGLIALAAMMLPRAQAALAPAEG